MINRFKKRVLLPGITIIIMPLFLAVSLTKCSEEIPVLYKIEGKSITSFTLPKDNNKGLPSDITGVIHENTIDLIMPYVSDMSGLVPEIMFEGKSLEPASGEPVDFSSGHATYTVIAFDKTRSDYSAIVRITGNSDKDIISFCFTPDDNPGIFTRQYCGVIADPDPWFPLDPDNPKNETIKIILPNTDFSVDFSCDPPKGYNDGITDIIDLALKPRIIMTGAEVRPADRRAVDFAFSNYGPIIYTVTARDGTRKKYSVIADHTKRNEKGITDFFISGMIRAEIDDDGLTVLVKIPSEMFTDPLMLDPQIEISEGAVISPPSGTTLNFTNPVTYTVTAEDTSESIYTVTVSAKHRENDITGLLFARADNPGLPSDISHDSIDSVNSTVYVTVPHGTDRYNLVPTISISEYASINPAGGTPQNFNGPVAYTVTAENEDERQWTVVVLLEPSADNDILTFDFFASRNPELYRDYIGAVGANTVYFELPYGTDVSNLVPDISISGVSISPPNRDGQDFSLPVPYTVTAENGDEKEYLAAVDILPPCDQKEIISFNFLQAENIDVLESDVIGVVNQATGTVGLTVPYGTDVHALLPDIAVSDFAMIDPEDGEARDFTGSVTYTVTAQDPAEPAKNYTVTVTEEAPSTENSIEDFRFTREDNPDLPYDIAGIIDNDLSAVTLTVPNGTNVTGLVPDIIVSRYALIDPPDGEAGDFTGPITYTVTAQDGTSTRSYEVTVNIITELIEALRPDAQAAGGILYNTCGFGMTDNWTCVNDVPIDDGTYVYHNSSLGGSAQEDTYGLANSSVNAGTINKISVKYRVRVEGTDLAGSYAQIAITNTGTSYATAKVIPSLNQVFEYSDDWLKKPDGNPWTWTDINNLQVKLKLYLNYTYAGIKIECSEIWVNVHYTPAAGTSKDILSYKFLDSDNAGEWGYDINGTVNTSDPARVDLSVVEGINITSLVPAITVSPGAAITPGSKVPQNFLNPVSYTVTAQDHSTKAYTVHVVIVPRSGAKDILMFEFLSSENSGALDSNVSGTIGTNTINLTVPCGTDVSSLAPDISVSEYAIVSPANHVGRDFTSPVTYTVTAQDSTTKQYTVTVIRQDILRPNGTGGSTQVPGSIPADHWDALNEEIPDELASYVFDGRNVFPPSWTTDLYQATDPTCAGSTANQITVYYRISRSSSGSTSSGQPHVKPLIIIAGQTYEGADVTPSVTWTTNSYTFSGTWSSADLAGMQMGMSTMNNNDFQAPVIFCTQMNAAIGYMDPADEKNIISFNFLDSENTALNTDVIGSVGENAVRLTVRAGTDVTSLTPDISIPANATINPPDGTARNFSSPVSYTVTAQNLSTKVYTVSVISESSVILRPNGYGDLAAIQNVTPLLVHYSVTNDQSDASYVYNISAWTNGTWIEDYYAAADMGNLGTISRIQLWYRVKKVGAWGGVNVSARGNIRRNSDSRYTTTQILSGSDWTDYSYEWTTDPWTTQPWTYTNINNTQIGVSLNAPYASGSDQVQCSEVWLKVFYSP